MKTFKNFNAAFLGTASVLACATAAFAGSFNIPSGDLASALNAYTEQSGVALIVSGEAVRGVRTRGVSGALDSNEALSRLLDGTGFVMQRRSSGAVTVTRDQRSELPDIQIAQAAPARGSVETVTVTSSKLGGADVQSIPISITALSQEQLTATQTAGGPDLVKQVPNLTFSKTNFTGYNIQIRGIGTQAISVTTDPAVAVAFNDTPFIRNHFFEQEFFDVGQVEVLRGPQGTLYGRNATAGVVNVISAQARPINSRRWPRAKSAISNRAASKAWSISRLSMMPWICASPANGPSAKATPTTKPPTSKSMAAICGRAVSRSV